MAIKKRLFNECAQLSTFIWFVLREIFVLPWCLDLGDTSCDAPVKDASHDPPNIQLITVQMHLPFFEPYLAPSAIDFLHVCMCMYHC